MNTQIEVDLDENYFTQKNLNENFLDKIKANYGIQWNPSNVDNLWTHTVSR